MKNWKKVLIASVICMANMGVIPALASMNPDTEAPIAGISVALNNYYTRNEEPQKTLAEELDSRAQKKAGFLRIFQKVLPSQATGQPSFSHPWDGSPTPSSPG